MASKQRKPSHWQLMTTVSSQTKAGKAHKIEIDLQTRVLRCSCFAHVLRPTEDCQHLKELLAVEVLPAGGVGNTVRFTSSPTTREEDPMTSSVMAHPGTNGHVWPDGPARDVLLRNVDHLLELRGLVRRAQEEERKLTQEIVATLRTQGLRTIRGQRAVAILEEQITLSVDPGLFLEAAGSRATEALRVSVTAARRILRQDELAAISEATTTPVLRVVAA